MSLKQKSIKGLIWASTQQFSEQFIRFGTSIILARILLPEEFGLIGMISIFTMVAITLIDSGMVTSLIRSDNLETLDYSTVFIINFIFSIFFYALMYFLAPFIADFYDQYVLIDLIRIYCLSYIINALSIVHYVHLTKNMDFKRLFTINFPAISIGSVIGIYFAFIGHGVWSLVWMHLTTSTINTFLLWIKSRLSFPLIFDNSKFLKHFKFGYKMTLSGIISNVYSNINLVLIGRFFSIAQVGFYTRANSLVMLPTSMVYNALSKVTNPMFSLIQHDNNKIVSVYKKIIRYYIFFTAPLLTLAGVLAEPLISFLLTDKWLPAVPYFQILCIAGIFDALNKYSLNILIVKGRSDLYLRLEIIGKVILSIGIVFAFQFGIYGLLWYQTLSSLLLVLINLKYSGNSIGYNLLAQIKNILPVLLATIIAGSICFIFDNFLKLYTSANLTRLIFGSIVFCKAYLVLFFLMQPNQLKELKLDLLNR